MKSTPAFCKARTVARASGSVVTAIWWNANTLPLTVGPGPHDAGAAHHAGQDLGPPLVDFAQQSTHVADAGDAIGQQSRQRARLGPAQVNVHVPQAGNQELPAR